MNTLVNNIYESKDYKNTMNKLNRNLPKDIGSKKENFENQQITISKKVPKLTNDEGQMYRVKDYYWPCVYQPYILNASINGYTSIEMLRESVQTGFRGYMLEIWDNDTNLVVQQTNMNLKSDGLDISSCFNEIQKGFNKNTLPIFLYLKLNNLENNQKKLTELYLNLIKIFKGRFMGRRYSFNGRNNRYSLIDIPLKECLGKIIICTNIYPTVSGTLNELINGTIDNQQINNNYQYIMKYDYTQETYKNKLKGEINNIKQFKDQSIKYAYSIEPIESPIDDPVNIDLEDCQKYGCQFVWCPYYLFQNNTSNSVYEYIKKFNKTGLILKPHNLRTMIEEKKENKKLENKLTKQTTNISQIQGPKNLLQTQPQNKDWNKTFTENQNPNNLVN